MIVMATTITRTNYANKRLLIQKNPDCSAANLRFAVGAKLYEVISAALDEYLSHHPDAAGYANKV